MRSASVILGSKKINISYKDFEKLGISGKVMVRDLWRQKDIAKIKTEKEVLNIEVPIHGVALYKFSSVK